MSDQIDFEDFATRIEFLRGQCPAVTDDNCATPEVAAFYLLAIAQLDAAHRTMQLADLNQARAVAILSGNRRP